MSYNPSTSNKNINMKILMFISCIVVISAFQNFNTKSVSPNYKNVIRYRNSFEGSLISSPYSLEIKSIAIKGNQMHIFLVVYILK